MRYVGILNTSFVNGDGARTVLFVSGCEHHCEGCQNKYTWDRNSGIEFTDTTEKALFSSIDRPVIDGLTISGGDPLYLENRIFTLNLCEHFRQRFDKTKSLWIYTGYLWEDILDSIICLQILEYVDVLVDGPYIKEQHIENKFYGSSNQRIINVQESLKVGKRVVLW